jgi:hypothetical protein
MAGDSNPGGSLGDRTATPVQQAPTSIEIDPKWRVNFDPQWTRQPDLSPDHQPLFKLPDLSFLHHDPDWSNDRYNDDKYNSLRYEFNNSSGLAGVYSDHHVNARALFNSSQWDDISNSASKFNLGIALNVGGTSVDMAGIPADNFQYTLPYALQQGRNREFGRAKIGLIVGYRF